METAPLSTLDAPRLPQCTVSFLAGGVGGKGKQWVGGRQPPYSFSAKVVTDTNHNNPMKSTCALSSSRGVQRGLSGIPDAATQAHRGPRSQGSDHGSKSQLAMRSEQGRDIFPCVVTHPEKGHPHRQVPRPSRAKGASKGPITPPPNMGHKPQPNSPLCGSAPGSRTKKWAANHGNWPTTQHLLQCTPPRTHLHLATPAT